MLGYTYCTVLLPHYAKEGAMIGFTDLLAELDFESLLFVLVAALLLHCVVTYVCQL